MSQNSSVPRYTLNPELVTSTRMHRIVHFVCYQTPLSNLNRNHESQTYYSTIPFSLYPQPGSSQTPSEFEMGLQQVNNSCLVESVLNEVRNLKA